MDIGMRMEISLNSMPRLNFPGTSAVMAMSLHAMRQIDRLGLRPALE
jgi:hypothetical protein